MNRLMLLLLTALLVGHPGIVLAGPAITPGALRLTATPVAVGMEAPYEGDDNQNASAEMVWRRQEETGWREGAEVTFDRKHRRIWASIWPLQEGETVEVKVSLKDPDAAALAPLQGTSTTRTLFLQPGGKSLYVSPTGNDNGPGTKEQPFRTLAHAAGEVQPGDGVLALSGVYPEGDLFQKLKGSPDRPIVIAAAPGEKPILDSSFTISQGSAGWQSLGGDHYALELAAEAGEPKYLAQDGLRCFRQSSLAQLKGETRRIRRAWFFDPGTRRLHVRTGGKPAGDFRYSLARHDYGFWLSGARHVVIRGFEIRFHGAASVRLSEGATGCSVVSCKIHNAPGAFFLKGETTAHNVIWRNEIYEPGLVDFPWGVIKESEYARQGIFCVAGPGTSICFNRIHGWFDGIAVESWKRPDHLQLNRDSDVMFNEIYNIGDDAIEADGGGVNMRIHGNRIRNAHTAISLAPVERGPVYCTRNEATFKALMFKLNVNGCTSLGWAGCYHNSGYCLVTGADGGTAISFPPTIPCSSKVFKNNVIIGNEWSVRAGKKGYILDGNCYFNVPGKPPRRFQWEKKAYRTIVDFRKATGQEEHGLYADPRFRSTPGLGKISSATDWLSECPSDHPLAEGVTEGSLHLQSGSPCIDSGVVIRGINQGFRGKGPDRGVWEYRP